MPLSAVRGAEAVSCGDMRLAIGGRIEFELALDDAEALRRLDGSCVLARVSPEHKLRLVKILQADGAVVAMLGVAP